MDKFIQQFPTFTRIIVLGLASVILWQFQVAISNNTVAMQEVKRFMEKTMVKMENHEVRITHLEGEKK